MATIFVAFVLSCIVNIKIPYKFCVNLLYFISCGYLGGVCEKNNASKNFIVSQYIKLKDLYPVQYNMLISIHAYVGR